MTGLISVPNLVFAQSDATLPSVTVTDHSTRSDDLSAVAPGGQVAAGARLGILGNLDVMDTPFNVISYTSDFIQDKQAQTLGELLKVDPSVRFTTSSGHPYENFRIRGFDVNQNDVSLNGMFGVTPIGHIPLEFVERVEVLKGPSALFSGMPPSGAVGGVINLVPKRAGDEPLTRATFSAEGSGHAGVGIDLGRRFGENKQLGLRINGALADGEGAISGQSRKRELISAALDLREGGLSASLDAYSIKESFRGGVPAQYWFTGAVPAAPDGRANQFPAAQGELDSRALIARVEYQFSPRFAVFGAIGRMEHDSNGFINGNHVRNIGPAGTSTTSLTSAQLGFNNNTAMEAGFRAGFTTGSVSHELVLQASDLKQDAGSAANSSPVFTTNIYNPVFRAMPITPTAAPKTSENTLSSLALVDTLTMWGDKLRLTIGARHQTVKTTNFSVAGAVTGAYDKSAVTPAIAAVFKPWGPNLSFYANYVQGLSKGDSVSTPTYAFNFTFAPYKTEQREVGIKWTNGSWTNTASLFEISKPMLITLAGNIPSDGGEKRVRGLEWNTFGELTRQVRLIGGIVYTDGVQTKTANNVFSGNKAVGTPRLQANLGVEWDTPWVPGLALGAGVMANSNQYINAANTQRIPGWGILDVGARYTTHISGRKTVLRFNLSNVADKRYYNGAFSDTTPIATVGAPRTASVSATMDF